MQRSAVPKRKKQFLVSLATVILLVGGLASPSSALSRYFKDPPSQGSCRTGMYVSKSWADGGGRTFKVRNYVYCKNVRAYWVLSASVKWARDSGMDIGYKTRSGAEAPRSIPGIDITDTNFDGNLSAGGYDYVWVPYGRCTSHTRYLQAHVVIDQALAGMHYGATRTQGDKFTLSLCGSR